MTLRLGGWSRFCATLREPVRVRDSMFNSIYLSIGLQPMSSIALVLLANMQTLYSGLEPRLTGALLATILLMQLFGPLATQTAIKGFGEATCLQSDDPAAEKPASNKGSWGDKS